MAEFEGTKSNTGSNTGQNENIAGDSGSDTFTGRMHERMTDATSRLRESAGQAREFVAEKAEELGLSDYTDRLRNINTEDLDKVWGDMKSHARQNPGQMMLIAAGVGFALGMLMRGGRRY